MRRGPLLILLGIPSDYLAFPGYGIKCDPQFPVVNVGNKQNPSYLPVEVCVVPPGQAAGTKLSPNQTRNMLDFAVRSPEQNAQSIVQRGTLTLFTRSSTNSIVVSFHAPILIVKKYIYGRV